MFRLTILIIRLEYNTSEFIIEICKLGIHIKILVSSDFYNFLFSYAYKICFIKKMTKASG